MLLHLMFSFVWNTKSECWHLYTSLRGMFLSHNESNATCVPCKDKHTLYCCREILNSFDKSWLEQFSTNVLGEVFLKRYCYCVTCVRIQLSVLYAGVFTHLRVGPLGLDLFSHLLRTAEQVITMPALQVEHTNTQLTQQHATAWNTACTQRLFLCDSNNNRNTQLASY